MAMSATSPQSGDEYVEGMTHGQVNMSTDNIVNTQQMDSFETETSNEQTNKDNLTNSEDEDQGCQLPSHVIIETVQYDDYIKQKNGDSEINYGEMIEIEDEDGDCDSDSVQWIEDDQELSPPAKKPNIDQPNNAEVIGQWRQPTVEAQPNQVNNQRTHYITVHLQCPLSNCMQTFPDLCQLNRHMSEKHSIRPHRCLVKECAQSFKNKNILGQHIKEVHSDMTEWHCDKCAKHYSTYHLLSCHTIKQHHLGQFQCSFPFCTFTGQYRTKMYAHYAQQHKPTLNCQHFGCPFRTSNVATLKRHERIHSGTKPYRCTWFDCDYAAARLFRTIEHIRQIHLAPRSVPNEAQLNPEDYVELVHELLN